MRGKILTEISVYEVALPQKLEKDCSGKTGNIFLLCSQYFMKTPLVVCNHPKALLATVQGELSTARRYHHVRDANARIFVMEKSVAVLERNSKPLRQRNEFELSLKLCHKQLFFFSYQSLVKASVSSGIVWIYSLATEDGVT
jgi:hypothetical protein